MRDAVIVDGVRSAIGKYGGGLSTVRPDDLLAEIYRGLMLRITINPAIIDDVFAGCGNQAGEDNRDVARMATLLAGFPIEVPGVTVNRNCASGLEAVNQAAKAVITGEGEVFIGSGVESMSRAPWSVPKPTRLPTFTPPKMYDTTVGWRYENPKMNAMYPIVSLGQTAENIAEEMQISREEQDVYAVESHRRAVSAISKGKFTQEIHPIPVPQRKGDPIIVDTDEHPRMKNQGGHWILATDEVDMSALRASFKQGGTVTAGNSSGINDGAAAVLVMDAESCEKRGLKPKLRWVGSASAGVDPGIMGYGPVPATQKLLKRFGLAVEDIALFEINEAFAAQVIGCQRQLGIDPERLNVNGGAIALGHPLGCSGTRILVTLMNEMERRSKNIKRPFYGVASLCIGVGMGVSTLVEWIGD
ncbi:MAG: beta-ketoadipyl CoA thiolase [Rhodospirillaceae bacterium TMED8]|nr:acetyl-CoA C-acyltransferase [Magnetovibrio sp.]OUT50231.1 MAG: beta-ketoadipyl CoA thiolase [Rhodospirillaceae bacterium TMED8]|tara:strand:- start:2344 stop:3591 length:1248 start_codon:yes stop_codon:yes gene_type:complete